MLINYKYLSLGLYTLLHFLVDGIAAIFIFSKLYSNSYESSLIVFIVYNTLAFVLQPFLGLLIDKFNFPKRFLFCSILSLNLAFIFNVNKIIATILLGIGNALFHISGAKYVTNKQGNDIIILGIFVSTGAFGLVIGQIYFSFYSFFIMYAFLMISFILLMILSDNKKQSSSNIYQTQFKVGFLVIILIVVFIRSYLGKLTTSITLSNNTFVLLSGISVMVGKILGGFLYKKLGISKVLVLSFIIVSISLGFGRNNQFLYLLGIMIFNFSMPLTLFLANQIFYQKEGFAFGLLAGILFPAYLLAMINVNSFWTSFLVVSLSLLSLGLLILAKKEAVLWN